MVTAGLKAVESLGVQWGCLVGVPGVWAVGDDPKRHLIRLPKAPQTSSQKRTNRKAPLKGNPGGGENNPYIHTYMYTYMYTVCMT